MKKLIIFSMIALALQGMIGIMISASGMHDMEMLALY